MANKRVEPRKKGQDLQSYIFIHKCSAISFNVLLQDLTRQPTKDYKNRLS